MPGSQGGWVLVRDAVKQKPPEVFRSQPGSISDGRGPARRDRQRPDAADGAKTRG